MNFIAIDIGASETKFATHNEEKTPHLMSNSFHLVDKPVKVIDDETGEEKTKYVTDMEPINFNDVTFGGIDKSDVMNFLELIVEKKSGNSLNRKEEPIFPMHFLSGYLASQVSNISNRPNVRVLKADEKLNYMSIIMAITISIVNKNLNPDKIKVHMMVPPQEVDDAREKFKELLLGKYNVKLPRFQGGIEVEFEISFINVQAEAYGAYCSIIYDSNGIVPKDKEKYCEEDVMSLDIGESTTDIVCVSNRRVNKAKSFSLRTGGQRIRGIAQSSVTNLTAVTDSGMLDQLITEGRISNGKNSYYDIGKTSEILNKAKRETANKIVSEMRTEFVGRDIILQNIGTIIISGGGSMESGYYDANKKFVRTTPALSEYIKEELEKMCNGIEVIHISDNPRMANLRGLWCIAFAIEQAMVIKNKKENKESEVKAKDNTVDTPKSEAEATDKDVSTEQSN